MSATFSRLVFVLASCALALPAQAEFDWGTDCSSGDGTFDQPIAYGAMATIGEIPAGKRSVEVLLDSNTDVDVQLLDAETGHAIIAWPGGDLNGAGEACSTYEGRTYCYSGYNGDQTATGLGREWIRVHGDTNRPLIMRAYGYVAGTAEVIYRWQASPSCNEIGNGAFTQWVSGGAVRRVGEIPVGKVNVVIELEALQGRDVDVQLIDTSNGHELVAWPSGDLNGPGQQTLEYAGMTIIYSGYNGVGGNWGHETIEIRGRVTRNLLMQVFGYQSGSAEVTYRWGEGVGLTCGGIAALSCQEGLLCKDVQRGVSDPAGRCHTESWCSSDQDAPVDCGNLMHIMVPGRWTCSDRFECVWQSGAFCSSTNTSLNYVGHSPNECAVLRFTCAPFQSYFSDACGCGCQCPQTIDCEPGSGGPSCDITAIRNVCPDTVIAL